MIPRLMIAGLVTASEQMITAGMRAADLRPEQLAPMVGKVLRVRITDLDLDICDLGDPLCFGDIH